MLSLSLFTDSVVQAEDNMVSSKKGYDLTEIVFLR